MNDKHQLDLRKVPRELLLILELLKEDQHIDHKLLTDIDWNMFIALLKHHRVYPVLYKKLKALHQHKQIPEFVMIHIQKLYQRNTFHMLGLSAVMEQVNKTFAENQIRIIFLKGPTLGHDLYGDISLRTSGDIDVLIPIDQLEGVEELLLDQGYEKDDYIKTVLNDWKWRHHHVVYVHPKNGIKLEVHWRLHPGPAKEPSFNELWERRNRSNLTSFPLYTLLEEDLFIYLLTHGSRHGWSRIRWLDDINKLMNKDINWTEIHKLLKKYHSIQIGGQGLVLTSQLLNSSIPPQVTYSIVSKKSRKLADEAMFYLENMVNLHTDPVPLEVSRYHKRHLFSLMSKRQKVIFVLSFLYPFPEDAETLRLPRRLHFLYFPLRPFLWAWRKTREFALS